ncbi:MAG: hypothetical protein ACOY0T_28130 [Myxococcota bacterium]
MNDAAFDLLNFYALCGDSTSPRVLKVPLERDLQQELTVHFESLRASFRARGEEVIDYDPGYRPEPGELFRVPDFRLPTRLKSLMTSAPTLPAIDDAMLESERLRALIAASTSLGSLGPMLLFQCVDARQVLRREGFTFFLSDRLFRRNHRAGLVVRDALDAIYERGALDFASEYVVRRFLDLSGLFEEATNQELLRFFGEELFVPVDAAELRGLADQWVRRKVKMLAQERLLRRASLDELLEHAERFQVTLSVRGGRLVVPRNKKDLKLLLRFLDEDFLESSLSQTRYVANSKRKLSPGAAVAQRTARHDSERRLRSGRSGRTSA